MGSGDLLQHFYRLLEIGNRRGVVAAVGFEERFQVEKANLLRDSVGDGAGDLDFRVLPAALCDVELGEGRGGGARFAPQEETFGDAEFALAEMDEG